MGAAMRCWAMTAALSAVAAAPIAGSSSIPVARKAEKMHREIVNTSEHRYTIELGGTLDEFNTFEYGPYYRPRFQPNISVTIANTGDTPAANPRIVVNGHRDWYSIEGILADIFRANMADEEKTFALWDWCRRNLSEGHDCGETLWGDERSVVRFLNCFGTGACGTFHIVMPSIGVSAGLECDAGVVGNGAHAVQRERYDGGAHFFDCMLSHGDHRQPRGHFPLALDNRTVASPQRIWEDRYLLARAGSTPGFDGILTYFGPGTKFWPLKGKWQEWRTMSILLRPGESMERTWETPERAWSEGEHWADGRPSGSGKVRYQPRLTQKDSQRDAEAVVNTAFRDRSVLAADPGRDAELVYRISSPYVLTGARVGASLKTDAAGAVELLLSFDGEGWESIWRADGEAREATISLDERPEFRKPILTHDYLLKARIAADAPPKTAISGLWLEASFQTYLPSMPSLAVGENTVEYLDDTPEQHQITIEHHWREAAAPVPPAPAQVARPEDGSESGFHTTFEWRMLDDCPVAVDAYEFFLSPRADLAWPLLVNYHSVVYSPQPKFAAPCTDAFVDGDTYYWRVRARSADGVWGPWSETWSFVARGPAPVRNPGVTFDPATGHAALSWESPDRGQRPACYEIYAGYAPGFTPLRQPRESSNIALQPSRVTLPPNLVTETTDTSFDITGRAEPFYRIVTVDDAGSRSQPTACVALPHPALAGSRAMSAVAGRPFEAKVAVISSEGLPMTDVKLPSHWGEDKFALRLTDGPGWLALDAQSRMLRGNPPTAARGEHRVTIELTGEDGHSVSREYLISVQAP